MSNLQRTLLNPNMTNQTTPAKQGGARPGAGRPKVTDKKQTATVRLYASDLDYLERKHGTLQKAVDKLCPKAKKKAKRG